MLQLLSYFLLCLLFLSFGVDCQTCSYSSNGYSLTLSNLGQLQWTNQLTAFTYSWTPCTNGSLCGINGKVMAGQLNNNNLNCNKLAVWNSTVPGIYYPNNKTWVIEFENGALCGSFNLPRTTIFYLRCGTGTNQLFSVTNPSGSCTYEFNATGPAFCASTSTTTTTSTRISTTGIPSTTTTRSHGNIPISGKLLLIIIILTLIVIILCCVLCIIICCGFTKFTKGFNKKEALISVSLSQSNQNEKLKLKNEGSETEGKSIDETVITSL